MEEEEIVHIAIENLDRNLHLKGYWEKIVDEINGKYNNKYDKKIDGIFQLCYKNKCKKFHTTVKKELRTYLIDQLIDEAKNNENYLIIAYKLYPGLKEKLRENFINYLEANGDMFINTKDWLLFLDTKKKIKHKENNTNRAFTPTGLKVVFEFLRDKALINKTQREIAERADVALGNIPQVLRGLQETGYLFKVNKKTYAINNLEELLHKWMDEYKNILQPTLAKGTFRMKPADRVWRDLKLQTPDTVWGGGNRQEIY